ncbi:hypothetical protein [Pseudomonas sp. FW300-N2A2]|uniref:hypothetical protein n=1 Tax=Pseudomonas sp. FW300-N2A2 TaxID=2751316 RepID=UPI001A939762|nr:hypothetical protein [Pseudomonas sp. FW300-N2A2]
MTADQRESNAMKLILNGVIVIVVVVGMCLLIPYFNNECLKPQVVEAHLENCNLLGVKDSCVWLKDNGVPEEFKVDKSNVEQSCINSKDIADFLVGVSSKGKIGG